MESWQEKTLEALKHPGMCHLPRRVGLVGDSSGIAVLCPIHVVLESSRTSFFLFILRTEVRAGKVLVRVGGIGTGNFCINRRKKTDAPDAIYFKCYSIRRGKREYWTTTDGKRTVKPMSRKMLRECLEEIFDGKYHDPVYKCVDVYDMGNDLFFFRFVRMGVMLRRKDGWPEIVAGWDGTSWTLFDESRAIKSTVRRTELFIRLTPVVRREAEHS